MIKSNSQSGFTLIEIIVSTAIFVTTLTLMLVLFTYALKINRRVEALRQVSQATRNFSEFLVREIRNGSIDYTGTIAAECPATYNATGGSATFLALANRTGDRECFYLVTDGSGNGSLWVKKMAISGVTSTEQVSPSAVTMDPNKFRFFVRPLTNPQTQAGGFYPGIQPFVSIVMELKVKINNSDKPAVIPYQTTVSTDNYTVPHR